MKRWATTDQTFAKTVSVLIVHLCNIWAKELANPFRRNLLCETVQALHLQRAKITLRHVAATIPWLWSTYRRRDEWGWLKTMFRCLPSRCFVIDQYIMCAHGRSLHVSVSSVNSLPSNWSQCDFAHREIFRDIRQFRFACPHELLPPRPEALISAIRGGRSGRSCSSWSMALESPPSTKWWRAQLIRHESGGGGRLACWLHEEREEEMKM